MSKKFSVIIVGLGQIGFGFDEKLSKKFVFTHTRAATIHDSFSLLYGIDPSNEKRSTFEKTTGLKSFSSLKEAPSTEVDIVVVATPTKFHSEIVGELNRFKPKLILVEKPCGETLEDARHIKKLADEMGASIFVNYIRRSDPAVMAVREKIVEGSFGAFLGGNILYSKGFGHNGSHYLSIILDYFGVPNSVKTLRNKGNDNLDVDLSWGPFGVTFHAGVEEKASLGEIDLIFENARVRFEQFGELISTFESKRDPLYPDILRFEQSKPPALPDMGRYQWNVYEHLSHFMNRLPTSENIDHALLVHAIISKAREV